MPLLPHDWLLAVRRRPRHVLDIAAEGRADGHQGQEQEGAHKAQGHEVAVGLWKVYKQSIRKRKEIFSSELNLLNTRAHNMQKRAKQDKNRTDN